MRIASHLETVSLVNKGWRLSDLLLAAGMDQYVYQTESLVELSPITHR